MYTDDIKRFKEMVSECNKIVFFGGAGVSTESGVKDFRSEDGIYKTVTKYKISPETILSRSFFLQNPKVYYDFHYNFFLKDEVEPNKAHKALSRLEKDGKLSAVITQNIDGLHQAAGSKNVIELHGTVLKNYCMKCSADFSAEDIKELKGEVPYCKECGGLVRPGIVLYEEPLDNDTTVAAVKAISDADMLIIGGTSLAVYPAAAYINYFNGKYSVLINRDETPFDNKADIVFREKIGTVLSDLIG